MSTNEAMARTGPVPNHKRNHRIGGWLPRDHKIIRQHVKQVVKRAQDAKLDYVPPIIDLKNLVDNNPTIYMLFNEMLAEVPPTYVTDPSGHFEIRDVKTLLDAINYQIQSPISYNDSPQIGTPINAILDWPMGTKAGFAVFLRDDVNACFSAILNYWGNYLQTPASVSTVTTAEVPEGWLSTAAQNDDESPGLHNFLKTYIVPDPNDVHYGFFSWDDFFTRKFQPGLRPVACPENSKVIASAAESTPFYIQENVQLQDSFWAKDQHYALDYLLGDSEMAKHFVGGTVYQAFLSADSYHNWHAPVSGKFLKPPTLLPGTYYSEPLLWGFSPDDEDQPADPDAAADARSQGYISCVAKRGVAFIQPDDASLGLIAVVMIGMAEVSSIEFDKLDHFDKGQEFGRFHFGGSTHCLVFGPGVKFVPEEIATPLDPSHKSISQPPVPVCSKLGTLIPIEGR